ncbi:Elongation factor Ts [Buchnera aphidicola (Protaphis terricola)]|uniref:translation elongation factor Ts n=1 Tax=Buchnera aphidicola TaxID=9 RepID=UPI003464626B
MISINAALIKKLRLLTGVGFMECKRALLEENGNIELSIDNLRKSGQMKVVQKLKNTTNQGAIFSKVQDHIGVIFELNCETDFVSKDNLFINLGQEIISVAFLKNINNLFDIRSYFKEKITDLIIKFGENIQISRFNIIQGDHIFSYVHRSRIGVLVSAKNLNKEILKNIAMHIVASKPEYIYPKDIPDSIFKREYNIQLELVKKYKKPINILKKIVDGRMNKFVNNISLVGQDFIVDSNKKVGQILKDNKGSIISFIRFELGEKLLK